MAAIEEHKPAEKRRALGRGLDSLLPAGPRVVAPPASVAQSSSSQVLPPPVVIPTSGSSVAAPPLPEAGPALVPLPGEIAEIHAGREKANSHFSQQQREVGHTIVEGEALQQIPLELIDENPYQTRRTFAQDALNELAESIKASGLAQPVVVRPGGNGRYVLVLGERRCRASKLAGKSSVPAIVRQLGNEQAAEMTIVENLQRQDLNCLEQAQAFARLSREFNLTQEQIGKRTGTSRESVANYMRLLKLPKRVLDLVGEGKVGFSEARVLLEGLMHTTEEAIVELAETAVRLGLTVRDLKYRVEQLVNPELHRPEQRPEKKVDPNVADAEKRLRESLGMRVRVMSYQGNKGQVVIRYESLADFDRIFERLSKDE
jgi:ParB family transcriptional regulator, chromosome partitioning protein